MYIKKKDLFVQVTYGNLAKDFDIPRYTHGLNVEFYMSGEELEKFDKKILDDLKSFLKKEGLSLRIHAPILRFDYQDRDSLINSLAEVYKRVFGLCGFLGASVVIAHAEFDYETDFPVEEQVRNAIPAWGRIAGDARAGGFSILLENHLEKDPALIVSLIEKIDKKDALQACFDAGHYNMCSSSGVINCLKKYPVGSIKEVHLADNLGDIDAHLPLGEGNIDFVSFFNEMEKRNEDAVYCIEPRDPDETETSLQFLRKAGILIG